MGPTESISKATLNNSLMPSGEPNPGWPSLKLVLVILLICGLLNWWLLAFTEIILTEYLDLFLWMSLRTSLKSGEPGVVFSGKQPDQAESLMSRSWLDRKDLATSPTSS